MLAGRAWVRAFVQSSMHILPLLSDSLSGVINSHINEYLIKTCSKINKNKYIEISKLKQNKNKILIDV